MGHSSAYQLEVLPDNRLTSTVQPAASLELGGNQSASHEVRLGMTSLLPKCIQHHSRQESPVLSERIVAQDQSPIVGS